jgi:hypothetical protein
MSTMRRLRIPASLLAVILILASPLHMMVETVAAVS